MTKVEHCSRGCRRWLAAAAMVLVGVWLAGCATLVPMPLSAVAGGAGDEGKVILLMTASVTNEYRKSATPYIKAIYIERPGASEKSDRFNFLVDDEARADLKQSNEYLLRMELPRGDYILRGFGGTGGVFPFIGFFRAPIHADLKLAEPGVFYLGHVDAIVRPRQEGEFRAGPSMPLLQQTVTGFAEGTFDVIVSDHFAVDIPRFRVRFPKLGERKVRPAILPPFDRLKAQNWWQDH